jgi:hypothetical protein
MNHHIFPQRTSMTSFIGLLMAFFYLSFVVQHSRAATCVPPPNGLVGWWAGEGNANDSSSHGNVGNILTGITFTPGEDGQAFQFDGSTGAVIVPASPSLAVQNFTIEAWINPSDVSIPRPILEYNDPNQYTYVSFWYSINPGGAGVPGALYGIVRDAIPQNYMDFGSAGNLLVPNQWSHVAFTFDTVALTANLYLNGVNVASTTFPAPLHPTTTLSANIGLRPEGCLDLWGGRRHMGGIDEVSVYNRALSASEIQAIYNAGSAGKCTTPSAPVIYLQPTNQTIIASQTVTMTVGAYGTAPLGYQWSFGGSPIGAATNSSLVLTNVQQTQAGSYTVQVTNIVGSTNSLAAILTVNPPPPCDPPPAGLVSWWKGDGDATDPASGNNGVLVNGVTFAPGQVGQAFAFNGSSYVQVPNNPSLNLTNELTLELWYKDTGSSGPWYGLIAKRAPSPQGASFGMSASPTGYGLTVYLQDPNYPSYQTSTYTPAPTPGVFHHVAATYAQATSEQVEVKTYIDGQLVKIAALSGNLARCLNSAPVTIGASTPSQEFLTGLIDEPTIYARALSATEIQAIYNAGVSGKCPTVFAPTILAQPADQTVMVSQTASFSVLAGGTPPLAYQWSVGTTSIPGATSSSLTLANVQSSQAGNYSVVVTNAAGSATSTGAVLTVNPAPPCAGPAPGLVSWWQGEGNALDAFGGNNGTVSNGITYIPGVVGQAFNFDGNTGAIVIPPSPNLAVQSLTIEAWIKPTDVSTARPIVEYGAAGELTDVSFWYSYVPGALYAIVRDQNPNNYMQLSSAGGLLAPNQWSHVAFTLDLVSNVAKLFLNGAPVATNNFQVSLHPHTLTTVNLGLRAVGSADLLAGRRHAGGMDEVSIYARALSPQEISAIYNAGFVGKCNTPVAPSVYSQPSDQTVVIGQTATFNVGVSGTQPLSYQWTLGGTAIPGATFPSLVLTNVQRNQTGTYAVVVTNGVGSVTSSNAALTVNFPPASVLAESSSADASGNVTVPIVLLANGNENALGFSLNFNPALLSYVSANLGSGAVGGTLVVNSNPAPNGQLGIGIILPTGTSLPAGTQDVVDVTFTAAVLTNATVAQLTFGDTPTVRKLSDPQAIDLAANFVGGTVSIPAASFEGDVSPRPNGDKVVTITDWVLLGRYAARLDYPTNASEYQRADCAPRSTLGDGAITVADWVQAGRYAVGLDPATRAGGPTNDLGPNVVNLTSSGARSPKGLSRQVHVSNINLVQGQSGTVSVYLDAQGDENALSFSLSFDPTELAYLTASPGADAPGATLEINTNQSAAGRAAFVLAMPIGSSFSAGTKEILKLNLGSAPSAAGLYPVALTDQPVGREVVDTTAAPLTTTYLNGSITINPPPSLTATRSQQSISLSWPLWATNFTLQEADGALLPSLIWSNVPVALSITNNAAVVTLPISGTTKFYRLQK